MKLFTLCDATPVDSIDVNNHQLEFALDQQLTAIYARADGQAIPREDVGSAIVDVWVEGQPMYGRLVHPDTRFDADGARRVTLFCRDDKLGKYDGPVADGHVVVLDRTTRGRSYSFVARDIVYSARNIE